MERRSFLQTATVLGIISFLPKICHTESIGYKPDLPIHFIGLGKSGSLIITEFLHGNFKGIYTSIENNPTVFDSSVIKRIDFNCNNLENQPLSKEIQNVFVENHHYLLIAPLGGMTGTLLAKKLYAFLNLRQQKFSMVVSTPFKFEGPRRTKMAHDFLNDVENDKRVSIIRFQDIRYKYGNMVLRDAYTKGRELFYETCVSQMIRG